jgi:hypothetical protein
MLGVRKDQSIPSIIDFVEGARSGTPPAQNHQMPSQQCSRIQVALVKAQFFCRWEVHSRGHVGKLANWVVRANP